MALRHSLGVLRAALAVLLSLSPEAPVPPARALRHGGHTPEAGPTLGEWQSQRKDLDVLTCHLRVNFIKCSSLRVSLERDTEWRGKAAQLTMSTRAFLSWLHERPVSGYRGGH